MCILKIKQRVLWVVAFLVLTVFLINPQAVLSAPFDSGSTGADGAFAPTADTILNVPPSGVFNFITISIPTGITVTFASNSANLPVTILASGDVTIDGTLSANGQDGTSIDTTILTIPIGSGGPGGPGGFAGGVGGIAPAWNGGFLLNCGAGLGPGAAQIVPGLGDVCSCQGSFATTNSCKGKPSAYGNINLLPLIGGSGGTGGLASSSGSCVTLGCNGGGGGGGGGAILIASSGTITINGSITADGGIGGNGFRSGGAGSGGAIRLISNALNGTGSISVAGAPPNGGAGRIRLEANTLSFSGTVNPVATISTPGLLNLSPIPILSITAIAGVSVPSTATGSFDSPDIILPSSTSSPVTVNLAASNIPVGTVVAVIVNFKNTSDRSSFNSTPLSGTEASSTATANVFLSTTLPTIIRADAIFTVQTASNPFPKFAEDEKVEKIRVASVLGGKSSISLITESGREVPWQ